MDEPQLNAIPTVLATPSELVLVKAGDIPYEVDDNFTNISQLHEDIEIVTDHKHIIVETLYLKAAPNRSEQMSYYTRNSTGRSATYDKILFGMDINAPAGNNIVAFMLGRGQNDNFYRDCIEHRDTGQLGPGGLFVVESPSSINDWMGSTNLPLMKIPNSIVPVDLPNSVCLPEKRIVDDTDRQHGFCYHNVALTLLNMHPMESMCCGNGCDGYQSFEGGKCACYAMSRRMSNVVLVCDFKAVTRDNKQIYARSFTSKKFSKMFFKNGKIPPDLRASQISARRERVGLRNKMQSQISYVNNGGVLADDAMVSDEIKNRKKGYTMVGWCRRGTIVDQAADRPNNRSDPGVVVDASILTYHLTSIRPTSPELLGAIEERRYDPTHLINVGIPAIDNADGGGGHVAAANVGDGGVNVAVGNIAANNGGLNNGD